MDTAPSAIAPAPAARHDGFTITLHWLTAILVVLQFSLAETWDFFPKPARHLMIVGHMSFGLVLAAVFGSRVLWRLTPGRLHFNDGLDLASRAAWLMHRLLYILVAAEIVLGVFTRWTDNQALSFFGFLIPSPFGPFAKSTGAFVDEIHDLNAWAIILLAGAHSAVALAHHYWLRDDVLRRMMPNGVFMRGERTDMGSD
ncbi:cytochrome b [Acidocella facilis]|jgi:cytochrome b561|uniref:cytochrome b n=1 Tax=Acidocella facilis TaxID=525 RepID=UPI001F22A18F|nr:cytochrome b/b6 domain-containing protein [Acidocella facilis]